MCYLSLEMEQKLKDKKVERLLPIAGDNLLFVI